MTDRVHWVVCRDRCAGGSPCCLRLDVSRPHHLHICKDHTCRCHARRRVTLTPQGETA